jgi:hypothetical protein
MDIAALVKRQESLVAEFTKALKAKGSDTAGIITRPIEIQQSRVEAIKARIAGLEEAKKSFATRTDAQIAALKAELEEATKTLQANRNLIDPIAKRTKPGSPVKTAQRKSGK